MNIKLKEHLMNEMVWLPQTRQTIIGKFIPLNMFPVLYKKYPQWFDVINEEPKLHDEIPFEEALEQKLTTMDKKIELKSRINDLDKHNTK
jgi:hypothetical protein